jgi:hypothetical protein
MTTTPPVWIPLERVALVGSRLVGPHRGYHWWGSALGGPIEEGSPLVVPLGWSDWGGHSRGVNPWGSPVGSPFGVPLGVSLRGFPLVVFPLEGSQRGFPTYGFPCRCPPCGSHPGDFPVRGFPGVVSLCGSNWGIPLRGFSWGPHWG